MGPPGPSSLVEPPESEPEPLPPSLPPPPVPEPPRLDQFALEPSPSEPLDPELGGPESPLEPLPLPQAVASIVEARVRRRPTGRIVPNALPPALRQPPGDPVALLL